MNPTALPLDIEQQQKKIATTLQYYFPEATHFEVALQTWDMLQMMHSHYQRPSPSWEQHAIDTRAWALEFIDAEIPAWHIVTLYRQTRRAKNHEYLPTVKDFLDTWNAWKKANLPDYRPSFRVQSGELTRAEDYRCAYGYSEQELIEARLRGQTLQPHPAALQARAAAALPAGEKVPCPPQLLRRLDGLVKVRSLDEGAPAYLLRNDNSSSPPHADYECVTGQVIPHEAA